MSIDANNLIGAKSRALATRMGEAATNLLTSLAPDQRAQAAFAFADDAERTRWYYTPNLRHGLPLSAMTRAQQRLAQRLAAVGLSRTGYVTTTTIMGLEMTLDFLEEWKRPAPGRDPILYYVSIFGEPSERAPWGWRFEGHHVSLNYTIVNGQIASPTPTFFGSNPAEVALNGVGTLRPLANVEDVARELMHALTTEQRRAAILSPAAPLDIMLCNRPMVVDGAVTIPAPLIQNEPLTDAARANIRREWQRLGYTHTHEEALRFTFAPKGLPASELNAAQREMLVALIRQYTERMPDEVAEMETQQLQHDGIDDVHLLWAGGIERHQPHYYRLQSARFLVEYDQAQDNANHIHSVWRDIRNDFGADVLAQHYAMHPH